MRRVGMHREWGRDTDMVSWSQVVKEISHAVWSYTEQQNWGSLDRAASLLLRAWLSISQWPISNCIVLHLFCILFYHNHYNIISRPFSVLLNSYISASFSYPFPIFLGLWVSVVGFNFLSLYSAAIYLWIWRLLLRLNMLFVHSRNGSLPW